MKGLFFSILFVLLFVLQGLTEEKNLNDSLSVVKSEISNLLLTRDFTKKIDLIHRINSSGFLVQLRSLSAKFELDTIYTQNWVEETQMLANSVRYNYDFDENGKKVSVKIYNWNSEENGWRIAEHIFYSFNTAGKIIHAEFQHYIAPLYKTFAKIDYSYSGDLVADETFFKKADEEDDWEIKEQTEYSYDSMQLLTTVYEKKWEDYDGIWLLLNKTEYEYDSFQNIILEARFDFESYTREWTQKDKTEKSYNESNKLVERIIYVVGYEAGQFIEDKKQTILYDSFGEIETEFFYSYDYDLDAWLAEIRNDYSASVPGKLYEQLSFNWNSESQAWELETRTDYLTLQNLHEDDILYRDFVHVHFPVYLFDNIVCENIEEYTFLNNDWVNSGNIKYQFTDALQVGVTVQSEPKVQVYPNPVVDYVNINTNNFVKTNCYIRDIQGRIVTHSIIITNGKLNLSALTSGIYFLELKQRGNIIYSGKIYKY